MIKFLVLLFALVLKLLVLWFAFAPSLNGEIPPFIYPNYPVKDDYRPIFTVINEKNYAVSISIPFTPLEEGPDFLGFKVEDQNGDLEYQGTCSQYTYKESDYLVLEPGESYSIVLQPHLSYDLTQIGNYSMRYEGNNHAMRDSIKTILHFDQSFLRQSCQRFGRQSNNYVYLDPSNWVNLTITESSQPPKPYYDLKNDYITEYNRKNNIIERIHEVNYRDIVIDMCKNPANFHKTTCIELLGKQTDVEEIDS